MLIEVLTSRERQHEINVAHWYKFRKYCLTDFSLKLSSNSYIHALLQFNKTVAMVLLSVFSIYFVFTSCFCVFIVGAGGDISQNAEVDLSCSSLTELDLGADEVFIVSSAPSPSRLPFSPHTVRPSFMPVQLSMLSPSQDITCSKAKHSGALRSFMLAAWLYGCQCQSVRRFSTD